MEDPAEGRGRMKGMGIGGQWMMSCNNEQGGHDVQNGLYYSWNGRERARDEGHKGMTGHVGNGCCIGMR